MGKVKGLELWWQLYLCVTSGSGLRKKPAITLCAFWVYRHWGSVQAVRPIGGVQVYLYSSMTTALEGVEGSASCPGRSLPLGKTRCPMYRRLGGPEGRSGQVRKISPPPGFDPRTVQHVASRYTDWATRPSEFQAGCSNLYSGSNGLDFVNIFRSIEAYYVWQVEDVPANDYVSCLVATYLFEKYSGFYGTQTFTNVFPGAFLWFLSRQMKSVHTLTPCFSKVLFIIFILSLLALPGGFPRMFLWLKLCTIFVSPSPVTCLAHPVFFDLISLTISGDWCKLWRSSLRFFFHLCINYFFLGPKFSSATPKIAQEQENISRNSK
jgi:hypothetical protein